jgi:hypothetical protein
MHIIILAVYCLLSQRAGGTINCDERGDVDNGNGNGEDKLRLE